MFKCVHLVDMYEAYKGLSKSVFLAQDSSTTNILAFMG